MCWFPSRVLSTTYLRRPLRRSERAKMSLASSLFNWARISAPEKPWLDATCDRALLQPEGLRFFQAQIVSPTGSASHADGTPGNRRLANRSLVVRRLHAGAA